MVATGVITLFDGVSSVVPTLTKKFGYAPTVAILLKMTLIFELLYAQSWDTGLKSSGVFPHKGLLPSMSKMYTR